MSSKHIEIKSFKLAHTVDESIKIQHVEKPYGEYSSPVVNISLQNGNKKVTEIDIPYENINDFLNALNESVKKSDSIKRTRLHDELNSGIGGGE